MGQELEAKIRVSSHDPIREKLRASGAVPHGITQETNVFFDTAARDLKAEGKGLRLRYNRRSDGTTHVITYKGPKQDSKFKQREEIEITVDDPAAAEEILAKLGFAAGLRFEKKRESWEWNGCKIELDTLDGIGTFVEVEAKDDEHVTAGLRIMGFGNEPQVAQSYAQMIAERARQ